MALVQTKERTPQERNATDEVIGQLAAQLDRKSVV